MVRPAAAQASRGARPPAAEFRAGLTAVLPVLLSAGVYGLLVGALAVREGLAPLEAALMSGLVFAGGSQFVALEVWRQPAPVGLLVVTALLVNLRHVPMGATLKPALGGFAPRQRVLALFLMADEVWALALRRAAGGPLAPAFYWGLGLALYGVWVTATLLGALLGAAVADPERYGLDFAFVAVFIGLLGGLWRGRTSLVPWAASAAAATVVALASPGPWYVAAGAVAGPAAAALIHRPEDEA